MRRLISWMVDTITASLPATGPRYLRWLCYASHGFHRREGTSPTSSTYYTTHKERIFKQTKKKKKGKSKSPLFFACGEVKYEKKNKNLPLSNHLQ